MIVDHECFKPNKKGQIEHRLKNKVAALNNTMDTH